MGKIIDFLKDSNHWKHLLGGAAIGALSDDWYCVTIAGAGVAGAMEYKDYQWGGKPDVIDFTLTCVGAAAGFGLRLLTLYIIDVW